jgi:hypothetical protein
MLPPTPMHAFMLGSAMYAELYFAMCRALAAAPWWGAGLRPATLARDVTGPREAAVQDDVAMADADPNPDERGPSLKVVPDDAAQVPNVTRGRTTRRKKQARPQPISSGGAPDSAPGKGY